MRNCVIHDKKSKYFFSETSDKNDRSITDSASLKKNLFVRKFDSSFQDV